MKSKNYIQHIIGLAIAVVFASTSCFAEGNSYVKAKVDTNQIRIGEQIHLELNAITDPGKEILFPILPDTFGNFEVVNRTGIDTIPNTTPVTLRQRFTITVFDSGFFVLPPFPFLSRDLKSNQSDTITTEALLIGVKTIPVDTTREIKDIKPVMNAPFPWRDYLPYFLLAALVLAGIVLLIIHFAGKKKPVAAAPPKPKIPAHIIALDTLKKINEEKIWQSGMTKKYHSEVSDTVRAYIEDRFEIQAMEQTSVETMKQFGKSMITPEQREKLKYILETADLAKFAKSEPVSYENEQSMLYAVDFVTSTIPVEKETEKKEAGK